MKIWSRFILAGSVILGALLSSTLFKQSTALSSGAASIGVIIRAQQAYRLENNIFAPKIKLLDARLDYTDYAYAVVQANTKQFVAKAIPKSSHLQSYAGGGSQIDEQFTAIRCESNKPGKSIVLPYLRKGVWFCGVNSHPIQ